MTMLQVAGFSLLAKHFVQLDDLKPLFADPLARPWAASLYSSLSSSYLKELDDFLNAFAIDPQAAMNDQKQLEALLSAYARIISGCKHPLYGTHLLALLDGSRPSYEIFARRLWKRHFGHPVNEFKWQFALQALDTERPISAFIRAFEVEEHYLNPDCQFLEFLAKLLSVKKQRGAPLTLEGLFEITQERLDILPLFLGKIILAIHQKDESELRAAMQEAHLNQTHLSFRKDFPRAGVEIEDAQGKIVKYYFELNSGRQAQRMEDDRQSYMALIIEFLKGQGLSLEQINFITTTFHQSAWHGLLQDQFLRQYVRAEKMLFPQILTMLRIRKNQQGQPVAALTTIGQSLNSLEDQQDSKLAGLLSIEVSLPEEKKEEREDRPGLILPGRSKNLHQEIRIQYSALSSEGCLNIPEAFSQDFILPAEASLKNRRQAGLQEMKTLDSPLDRKKAELARTKADLENVQLASGDRVASGLKEVVQAARQKIKMFRKKCLIKSWVWTLITAVGVAAIVTTLLLTGVITGGLVFAGILGASVLLSGLAVYLVSRNRFQAQTKKLVDTETNQINQRVTTLRENERRQQKELRELEAKQALLKREQKILEHTALTRDKQTNLLEEKLPSQRFNQELTISEENQIVVSLSKQGRVLEFPIQSLRSLVSFMKEKLEGNRGIRWQECGYRALGESLAEMLSEKSGIYILLRYYNSNPLNQKALINMVAIYGSDEQLKLLKRTRIRFGTNSFITEATNKMKIKKSSELDLKPEPIARRRSWAG